MTSDGYEKIIVTEDDIDNLDTKDRSAVVASLSAIRRWTRNFGADMLRPTSAKRVSIEKIIAALSNEDGVVDLEIAVHLKRRAVAAEAEAAEQKARANQLEQQLNELKAAAETGGGLSFKKPTGSLSGSTSETDVSVLTELVSNSGASVATWVLLLKGIFRIKDPEKRAELIAFLANLFNAKESDELILLSAFLENFLNNKVTIVSGGLTKEQQEAEVKLTSAEDRARKAETAEQKLRDAETEKEKLTQELKTEKAKPKINGLDPDEVWEELCKVRNEANGFGKKTLQLRLDDFEKRFFPKS